MNGAIEDYNEVIKLEPNNADAYMKLGLVRKTKGDLEGAIADFDEAINLKSDFDDAYYNRATAWEQKKDYSEAITDYQKYLDLGGGTSHSDQAEVEELIKKLKRKLVKKKSVVKKKAN